jgi:hypothetical protein
VSFSVFFDFSSGLATTLTVPTGTKARVLAHVEEVEGTLSLRRTKYLDNPMHWERTSYPGIDNKVLCETVERHNELVRRLYDDLAKWAVAPVEGGETLTPEDAQEFWHGLTVIDVEPSRWTPDYYRARMDHLYEVMRGRESEGVTFDVKALTPKQAAAVIRIFDRYLDPGDLRLDVPHGRDYLASSYDGGYDWCGKCYRPIASGDEGDCRRRKCPLQEGAA